MSRKNCLITISRGEYTRLINKVAKLQIQDQQREQWSFWGQRMFLYLSSKPDLMVQILKESGLVADKSEIKNGGRDGR